MTGRSGRTKTGKRDPYPEKHIRKNRTDTETSTDTKTDTKTDKTTMKRNTGYRMKNGIIKDEQHHSAVQKLRMEF